MLRCGGSAVLRFAGLGFWVVPAEIDVGGVGGIWLEGTLEQGRQGVDSQGRF